MDKDYWIVLKEQGQGKLTFYIMYVNDEELYVKKDENEIEVNQ